MPQGVLRPMCGNCSPGRRRLPLWKNMPTRSGKCCFPEAKNYITHRVSYVCVLSHSGDALLNKSDDSTCLKTAKVP